jgi:hypothetical protein
MSSTGVTFVPIKSNGHVDRHSNGLHKASTTQPLYENVETVAFVVEKPKGPFKLEPIALDEV